VINKNIYSQENLNPKIKIYKELKKKKIKIINEYTIKNKLFIIIYDNKKVKILKYFLDQSELPILKNEIKGYHNFSKNNIFNIPKVYSFSLKKNNLHMCLEYINGRTGNYLELNKFYNKRRYYKKKTSANLYLNKMINFYKERIDSKSMTLIKKLKITFKNKKNNLRLFTTFTHGDFAKYNSIKNKSKFYIIDFEKFRERIILYDQINWVSHSILYNLSKIFSLVKFKKLKKIFLLFCEKYILIIFFIFRYIFNYKIFTFNEFKTYFIFFILEKYLICKNDYYKINNKNEKKYIKNLIYLSEIILSKLISHQLK
jgi:hypothetical protein